MGNRHPIKKINFEDMQNFIQSTNIIISTLPSNNQYCLIPTTLDPASEIKLLNDLLKKDTNTPLIVYGMNCCDNSLIEKYNQLNKLGFSQIYVYPGGIFEWLLLQDIYGEDSFPTTKKELDILKYKGNSIKKCLQLTN